MADIREWLQRIRSAIYGEEVRGAIYNSIDLMNQECETLSDKVDDLEDDLDTQISAVEEKVDDVRDIALTSYPTDTASGSIASFSDGADSVEVKSATVQIVPKQAGSGDPSPDNVRPISGHTGANVVRAGVNLFNASLHPTETKNGVTCTNNGDGTFTLNGTATAGVYFNIFNKQFRPQDGGTPLPFGAYRLTGCPAGGDNSTYYMYTTPSYTPDRGTGGNINNSIAGGSIFVANGYTCNNLVFKPMLRIAGTGDDTFIPYSGTTYPITFPTEAGTVYGGTLTYEGDGVWTVVSNMPGVDLGTLTWAYNNLGFFQAPLPNVAVGTYTGIPNALCSNYATGSIASVRDGSMTGISVNSTGYVYVRDPAYNNAETFKAAMSGVQLVYEVATPQTFTLTTEQVVNTILGQNNFWADCGDTSVTYRADVQLYIQKKTGSTDDDMIADMNIPNGKYFMIGRTLYLSTSAIAQGEEIIPNTNCVETDFATALNTIMTTEGE